jgi:threonine-phosphate decarboxylase
MQHGGNIYQFAEHCGCLPKEVVDFSANINPNQAVEGLSLANIQVGPYGDPDYTTLKQALFQRYPIPDGVDIEVFNGASAAIFALLRWLKPKYLVLFAPLYVEYQRIAEQLGSEVTIINRLTESLINVPLGSTLIFVNPSTPDGLLYKMPLLLEKWLVAGCTLIVDESFLDFCESESVSHAIVNYPHLYIIKSLSKFYGCAGIRIGVLLAQTEVIAALKCLEPAWKLSSLDMAYMQKALENTDFISHTKQQTIQLRAFLSRVLKESGLFAEIYAGQANFLLARLPDDCDGYALQVSLVPSRILIRVCENFEGLDTRYVRFAVKEAEAIKQLENALNGLTIADLRSPK